MEAHTSCWAVGLMPATTCTSKTSRSTKSSVPFFVNVLGGVYPFLSSAQICMYEYDSSCDSSVPGVAYTYTSMFHVRGAVLLRFGTSISTIMIRVSTLNFIPVPWNISRQKLVKIENSSKSVRAAIYCTPGQREPSLSHTQRDTRFYLVSPLHLCLLYTSDAADE